MKTARLLSPRFCAARALAVGVTALLAALGTPCHAQYPGQPPAPTPPPPTQAPPPGLPDGTDQLFALMGTNDLIALSTPEGYERIRQLVRAVDGDTDIIRTKVVTVDTNVGALTALGVSLKTGNSPVSASDTAKLQTALASGKLTTTETLRVMTRENTVVDTLLHSRETRSTGGGTPFTLIPREARDGQLTLEILGPVSTQIGMQSGQTATLALPGITTDSVRLLFLTPTVLPSHSRY